MEMKIYIRIAKILLWIAGLYLSARYSLHTIYFIVSGFYLMFTNFGKRQKGTLSAYSVFNENFQRLHGTMDGMNLFKNGGQEELPKIVLETKTQNITENKYPQKQQYFKNQSKYSNQSCYCGSGIKFKKCCLKSERIKAEEQRTKRIKGN